MKALVGRWGSRGGRLLLTLTAIVGALCAVVAVLALVLGVRPIVFRSGSMAPAVDTGALGFSRTTDAADLRVGDIVTVTNAQKKTVTHRIVAIGPGDGSATLQLKGDDNPVADQEIYTVASVPKLWFAIPDGGYVIAWFSKAPGSYLLGGYVMLMLMLAFRRRQDSDDAGTATPVLDEAGAGPGPAPVPPVEPVAPGARKKSRRGPFAVVTAGAIVALAAAVVSGWSQTTWAAWNDTVATSGTSIATGTWGAVAPPAPTGVTCTAGSANANTITISWTAVPSATNYRVTRTPGSPISGAATSQTFTGSNNQSGTAYVQAQIGAGPFSANSTSISYTFGNGNNKVPTCD
ncbi:signal peptidase I [Nocardioides marmoriginsengisoli]|nr:signal peptidase I [Nocardioides marmoriginsengisoli]